MAVTMTLHNLPEGFAVAFAAFTDFGPVMALAIAIHNIPEVRLSAAWRSAAQHSRARHSTALRGAAQCSVLDVLEPDAPAGCPWSVQRACGVSSRC